MSDLFSTNIWQLRITENFAAVRRLAYQLHSYIEVLEFVRLEGLSESGYGRIETAKI